jgi:four helix bundle protein
MRIERFEDLDAWKEARKLTVAVYQATQNGVLSRDFGLSSQMQRAAVSSMANVAEGFGRCGTIEFARFLSIAHASVIELESHLYIAKDLDYLPLAKFQELYAQSESVRRLIGGLMNYLKTSATKPKNQKTVF